MKHNDDIEKDLKLRLRELQDDDNAASAKEVRFLLERCKSYRDRLQERDRKHQNKLGPLRRELSDLRRLLSWARDRIDPEGKGLHYSQLDLAQTALLVKEIEQRRGKIVASRLLYGEAMSPDLAEETLGALQAAIAAAKKSRDQWYDYRNEAMRKANQR